MVLLALAACRMEHTVYVTDSIEATVKKPPAGMMQLLGPDTTVRYRGRTIFSAPMVAYMHFNDAVGIQGRGGVIMVRRDGTETFLPCDGAAMAPERFPGIDCWTGLTPLDFGYARHTANGEVLKQVGAPQKMKDCGRAPMGYLGYDPRGEPIVFYECTVDGARLCRSATLDDPPIEIGEIEASTAGVSCAYVMRNQGRPPAAGVKAWSVIE